MIDIVNRLRFDATRCELQFSKGVAGNINEAADEIKKLRSAIMFWRMARYPENRPEPHDMEGRCQVQAALDLAENTLYELSKDPAVTNGERT